MAMFLPSMFRLEELAAASPVSSFFVDVDMRLVVMVIEMSTFLVVVVVWVVVLVVAAVITEAVLSLTSIVASCVVDTAGFSPRSPSVEDDDVVFPGCAVRGVPDAVVQLKASVDILTDNASVVSVELRRCTVVLNVLIVDITAIASDAVDRVPIGPLVEPADDNGVFVSLGVVLLLVDWVVEEVRMGPGTRVTSSNAMSAP